MRLLGTTPYRSASIVRRASRCSACSGAIAASTRAGAAGRGEGEAAGDCACRKTESMLVCTTVRIPLSKRTTASRAALRISSTRPRPKSGWSTTEPIITELIFPSLGAAQLLGDLLHYALRVIRFVQPLAFDALLGQNVHERFHEMATVAR